MKEVIRKAGGQEGQSDDKSDTVMTGFNTVEINDWSYRLLAEGESEKTRRRSKSLGNEVKVPFIRDTPSHSNELGQIDEIDDSQDSDLDGGAEKRDASPLVRLPAAKRLKEKKDKNEPDVK